MAYEDPLKEYLEKNPDTKLKVFKIYARALTLLPIVIALGVMLFILIQFGVI